MNRDIITIGASAGGIEAVRTLVRRLPSDLDAAVFCVIHTAGKQSPAEAINGAGGLPAVTAEDGQAIRHGRVYVAPGDVHLLIDKKKIMLRRGPRENLSRPAIDPLFRSAAVSFGSRVIGVVLTGRLFDGTSGLRAIQRCGGVTVVQDPEDAAYPDMPRNAIDHLKVDHAIPLSEMADLLVRLSNEPAGTGPPCPDEIRMEVEIAARERSGFATEDQLGQVMPFTCPDCGGSLWQTDDESMMRFRCHLGHAFTAPALLQRQELQLEQALWSAIRVHEERAELLRRLAQDARERTRSNSAGSFETRAEEHKREADAIRQILFRREERSTIETP